MTYRTIRERLLLLAPPKDHGPDVHFHQGPQGEPAVCYEARCDSPRLSV